MKKYKSLDNYDFSGYAEEISGDALFLINGGAEIENSNKGVANAKPGDTLTRNDGTTVTITQGDIDWAKKQVGESETTATNSTPTSVTETSNSQPQQTSSSTSGTGKTNTTTKSGNNSTSAVSSTGTKSMEPSVMQETAATAEQTTSSARTSSEYQGVPPQYWDALDEQKAKKQQEKKQSSCVNSFVTQDIVGQDLGLPNNKTCLLTDWINAYISEGMTYQQCVSVVRQEIENGNIRKDDAYMCDQLSVSKSLAKELKKQDYDGKYLQYPWIDGVQVQYQKQNDFNESKYIYGIGQYTSVSSNEYHYELFYKDGKYDPYPKGIESCSNWKTNSLKYINPIGWYE